MRIYPFSGLAGWNHPFVPSPAAWIAVLFSAISVLTSGCQPTIIYDEAALNSDGDLATTIAPATALSWAEVSPTKLSSITARWTPTPSISVRTQQIELFSDGSCTHLLGSPAELLSGVTSDESFSALAEGTYSFRINTIDQAGAPALSSCSPPITIDRTSPSVTVEREPTQAAWTNALPLQFSIVFNEPINPATLTVSKISQGGTATGITWQLTDSGDHRNFTLRATAITGIGTVIPSIAGGSGVLDLAGNANQASTSADHTVTYDTTPVTVTLNQATGQTDPVAVLPVLFDVVFSEPIEVASFTAADIGQTGSAASVSWSITNPSSDQKTFVLAATAATGGTLIPTIAAGRVTDRAGNGNLVSSSTDNSVTYDTTLPLVTGLSDDLTSKKSKAWGWSCDRTPCTYRYVIDQAIGTAPAGAYDATTTASQASGNGTYYIHVQARDSLGNVSAVRTVSAVLDNTAPPAPSGLALISPATSPGTVATPTFRVSGVNSGDTVSIYTDSGCGVPGLRASGVASGGTIDLASNALSNGVYSFYARSVDPAGNVSDCSSAKADYVLDTAAVSVTGLTNDAGANKSKTWNWGCNKANCTYRYAIDQQAVTALAGAYGSVTTATQGAGDGTYYIHVQARDEAGNESAVTTVSAVLDNTAPPLPSALALVTPASSPGNVTTPMIRISGLVAGDSVELHADAACTSLKASGTAVGATLDLTSSALAQGIHSFYAKVTDPAGNTLGCSTAHADYTLDTSAVTVTGLADDSTAAKTKSWSWSCSKSNCTYRYAIDQVAGTAPSGAYSSTTSDAQSSGTGIYYLHVQARDEAGNESVVRTVSAVLDNSAPTAPSGLTLISPASSPSQQTTPTIRVSGLSVGDTVELHGNAGCTALRATGISTGASFDLISSALSEGVSTFYARTIDPAGNASSCSTANQGYTVDLTAPTVPSGVACGSLSKSLTSSPEISWGASTDAHGIGKYQVAIGTSSSNPNVATWADQGTSQTATINSLSLTTGNTYYCLVRAVDLAGNTSVINYSTWVTDSVLPSQPGLISYTPSGNAAGWFNSTSISPVFNWGASTDSSGIGRYEVAIGTTPGGTEVVNWTSNGTATTKQFSGLGLSSGATYYFSVRAIDNAENASTPRGTNWGVDTAKPTTPGSVNDGTSLTNLGQSPAISWTASGELLSGIDRYEVAIGTTAGGTNTKGWTSVGNVTTTTVTGLTLTAGTVYYASVRAIDGAGNVSSVGQGDGWTAQDEADPCLATPALGTQCFGGALYAGQFDGGKYMVTPSGCTGYPTPTCAGGLDSLTTTTWGASTTDLSIENTPSGAPSSSSQRGDVTTPIIAENDGISGSPADYCNELVYGGYSDWYLPSKSETAYLYCHSSASGGAHNVTFPQENPNCTAYGGRTYELTGFKNTYYWTSSEYTSTNCWRQDFGNGYQSSASKSSTNYIRCVRRY